MRTQAAVLTRIGAPLEIVELEVPSLERGQVLVEIQYSGVCGTQIGEVAGRRGPDPWIPHCLGHEATAVVLEVGPDVTRAQVGDNVVLTWIQAPGILTKGATYASDLGIVNSGPVSTLMRHAVVGETRLSRMPDMVSPITGVALGCPAPTGLGAVINVLKPKKDQSLVVFGAGGVGLFAIRAAFEVGVQSIICIEPNGERRKAATEWGATAVFDNYSEEAKASCEDLKGGTVDAVVDTTGDAQMLGVALKLLKPRGGAVVVVGNAPHGTIVNLDIGIFNSGKSIRGTWGGDTQPDRDFVWMAESVQGASALVENLYSEPFPLEGVNLAIEAMATGAVGRALIKLITE